MLPLLLGLGGSALGAAGMLGGMGALAGGALGSGLGSLAQGDDLVSPLAQDYYHTSAAHAGNAGFWRSRGQMRPQRWAQQIYSPVSHYPEDYRTANIGAS